MYQDFHVIHIQIFSNKLNYLELNYKRLGTSANRMFPQFCSSQKNKRISYQELKNILKFFRAYHFNKHFFKTIMNSTILGISG
jgi:hypothetical protein